MGAGTDFAGRLLPYEDRSPRRSGLGSVSRAGGRRSGSGRSRACRDPFRRQPASAHSAPVPAGAVWGRSAVRGARGVRIRAVTGTGTEVFLGRKSGERGRTNFAANPRRLLDRRPRRSGLGSVGCGGSTGGPSPVARKSGAVCRLPPTPALVDSGVAGRG